MFQEREPLRRTQLLTAIIETASKWWSILVPLAGAAVSGYFAYLTSALAAYAPFSRFAAALAAAAIIVLISLGGAKTADLVARWNYIRKITASPPAFNPLDRVFTRRQIKLSELRNPFNPLHDNKTFLDCEIIGPGVLYFDGNTNLEGIEMVNCDCVAVRDGAHVHNLTVLRNTVFRGGKIYGATLLFQQATVADLTARIPGMIWIT